jgi:cellulose synthase/poly-beta-1,6-N-acetylglucosamine synthase-like glycosyltransferase
VNLLTPPCIAPVPQSEERPFWSVMIPTYNTSDLLEKTLRSVLNQNPGPDRIQAGVRAEVSRQSLEPPDPIDLNRASEAIGGSIDDRADPPDSPGPESSFGPVLHLKTEEP